MDLNSAREKIAQLKGQPPVCSPSYVQVMKQARLEAARLHHPGIGAEHLLAAILQLENDPRLEVVKKSGITLEVLQTEMARLPAAPGKDLPLLYTPRVTKIIKTAATLSMVLKNSSIGHDHLLYAILDEPCPLLSELFLKIGFDRKATHRELLAEMKKRQSL